MKYFYLKNETYIYKITTAAICRMRSTPDCGLPAITGHLLYALYYAIYVFIIVVIKIRNLFSFFTILESTLIHTNDSRSKEFYKIIQNEESVTNILIVKNLLVNVENKLCNKCDNEMK